MAGWGLLTTEPAVYVCIIHIFPVSVYKVHWLTGVLKQGLWPLKQNEAMSLRARSRKLITCSKQDIKHEPRMSFKLWPLKNGFVWCLIFIFRLHVLWIHLSICHFWSGFLTVCMFMLSVSFEDPGAQGASGPWSSPEPHQIFPSPAQVSHSQHHLSSFCLVAILLSELQWKNRLFLA